jgi:Outer membrane protein beta-barrel domain
MKNKAVKLASAFFLLFLVVTTSTHSQKKMFKASILGGINLAQVDGDYQTGYDRQRLCMGVRGGFALSKHWDLMSELFYNEKGTIPKPITKPNGKERNITIELKYAEIPITINYHTKANASGFYNWTFHAGVSYGRLLSSRSLVKRGINIDSVASENLVKEGYNPHDIASVWGLSYNFRPHFGVRLQQSFSISHFYTNPVPKVPYDPRWIDDSYRTFRNYFVSVQLYYDFFALQLKQAKKKQ